MFLWFWGDFIGITELFVQHYLQSIKVYRPYQLGVDSISKKTGIIVKYWQFSSEAMRYKNMEFIILNENSNKKQMWQDFGHEIYHLIGHVGRQEKICDSLLVYQEKQADYFAYHFCVPTFMLQDLKEVNVYDVMRLFNVEFDFALRRIEMYRNKMIMKGEKAWQGEALGGM